MKLQHAARAHIGAVGSAILALTTSLDISAHEGAHDPDLPYHYEEYEPDEILEVPDECHWWTDVASGKLDVLEVVNGDGEPLRVLMAGGNLMSTKLTFNVELLRGDDCAGDKFYLQLGSYYTNTGPPVTNEITVDVVDWNGSLVGGLYAEYGQLPKVYDEYGNDIPSGDLGPLVLTRDFGNPLFTLLDAQVLAYLGPPRTVLGAVPASTFDQDRLDAYYEAFVTNHQRLYSLLLFRADLSGISSSWRRSIAGGIRERAWGPWVYHERGRFFNDHHHVQHLIVRAPHDADHWGGWWDGHRRLLTVLAKGVERDLPFGRLPTWDTSYNIPSEFDLWIASRSANNVPTEITAAEVCDNYPPDRDARGMEARLETSESELETKTNNWHNGVHLGLGGKMGNSFTTAAQTPIFYPWHTTVDQIWRNWQLCWPSWEAWAYTWDQDQTLDYGRWKTESCGCA